MSEKEVTQLLKTVTNLKHKTILYLTYSAGLRVGEVVRLRCSDLDIERQTIIVRQERVKRIEELFSPILLGRLYRSTSPNIKPIVGCFRDSLQIDILRSAVYKRF